MGASILFVLCAVISVSTYSDSSHEKHLHADTFKNTRFKRESEVDSVKREHRVILTPLTTSRKPIIRPVSPVHTRVKPNLVISPNNVSPSKIIVPMHHNKAKALTNTTESYINSINITDDDLDRKVKDTDLDEILKPLEKNLTVDETIIANTDNEINCMENDFMQNSEIKEQQVQEAPKLITDEKNKETVASVEKRTRNDMANKIVNPTLHSIEKDIRLNLDYKQTLPADTSEDSVLLIRNPKEKSENLSKLLFKDDEHDQDHILNHGKTLINLANNVSNHSNASAVGVKIGIMPIPLSFTSTAITSIPKAKPVDAPKVKQIRLVQEIPAKAEINETPEDSADAIFRKVEIDDNKTIFDKNMEHLLLPESIKNEPVDEILIQNNNYEELFESSSSQYLPRKLNALELCPAPNWNNFQPTPYTPLEKSYEPGNADVNNNKPYSYSVQTYPNHYVVDAYNGYKNGYYNKNLNQGYNNVNQPLAINVGNSNYSKGTGYPKDRIWRSWQNNQIVIKPKLANCVNKEDLYKNINEYIPNAHKTAVNNGAAKIFSTNGKVNQNASPRSYNDPFQLSKRYGY